MAKSKTEIITTWDDVIRINNDYFGKKWIFRGQGPYGDIKSSLERALDDANEKGEVKHRKIEKKIIRSFIRKAHLYVEHPPEIGNTLEWLALMRHYGAPTRLSDWTYSFYVAVFFAIIGRKKEKEKEEYRAEIWALDAQWFVGQTYANENIKKMGLPQRDSREDYKGDNIQKENDFIHKLIDENVKLIYNVTPFRLNPRITIQQGTFLIPGDIGVPFMDNINEESLYPNDERQRHFRRIDISITVTERNNILSRLASMNISKATLYPDLGGFAESLNTHRCIISGE